MKPSGKVLFIGVDAMDKDLIEKWAGEGQLPTFQSLFDKAAWGATENPTGLYVGAVWPSFYTGVSPARHTRHCHTQLKPGSYELMTFNPSDVQEEPFWNHLSRSGKKVAVIDVPKTCIAESLNGIHIVDFASHDPEVEELSTWPASLKEEIAEIFGDHQLNCCNAFRTETEEFVQFKEELLERLRKKKELTAHYLKKEDWDCFMTVIGEAHCIGHQCWHLHDPAHPRHLPEVVQAIGDPMLEIYKAIDASIAEILDLATPDTTVFVLASHGMGPHYDASFLLDQILLSLENPHHRKKSYRIKQVVKKEINQTIETIFQGPEAHKYKKKYSLLVDAVQWVRHKLPPGVGIRRMIRQKKLASDEEKKQQRADGFKNRTCFPIPNNDAYGGVRINLVGREPNGKVHPGQEYEEYCQTLTQDLLSLTNVKTGESVVRQVLRTADLYQGNHLDSLPDLLIEWNRNAPVSVVHSAKTGTLQGEYVKCRTGDHKSQGLFFALGDDFKAGQVEGRVSVMDFAPTMADLLGVEMSHLEGHSIAGSLARK